MKLRTRMLLIVLVLGGVGALIGIGALMLKADQDAAVKQYGAETVALCKNAMDKVIGTLPDGLKIVFIDASLSTVTREYQDKLKPENAATSQTDVTHVACLKQFDTLFDTDSYGGKYTCTRYARDMAVALFDVKTSQQVGYWVVKGATPPECPDKTDKNLTKNGNPPIAAQLYSAIGLN